MSLQFELHHFMGKGAGGNRLTHFEKLRVAKLVYPPPFFFIKLKKNTFFCFIMKTYIVQLAKGIRIFGKGYILKP
jgi:hypothetical protein